MKFSKIILPLVFTLFATAVLGQSVELKQYFSNIKLFLSIISPDEAKLLKYCDINEKNINALFVHDNKIELDDEKYELNDLALEYYNGFQSFEYKTKCQLLYSWAKMRPSAFAEAKKLDVPQQLCYLPIAISAFDKNYTNAFGAYGTWGLQYLPSVKFGMIADSCYDERLDFELCSSASLKYLKFLHQTFGTWDYAITAYVCGPTNIRKAQVGSYSFAETFSKLTASEKYLFYRFLALLRWMEENETINFSQLIQSENTTVDSVVVSSKMHFNQISEVLGIDLKTLQQLNPLFICNVIDGRNYPKTIYLPQNCGSVFIAKSDSIAVYKDSVYFPKYAVNAVTVNATEVYTPVSPGKDYDAINYVIKSGDNLGAIAEKYGVKVADLQDWNNISGTNIYAGKQITIYVKKGQTVKVTETVAPVKPKTSPNVFNGYEFYENYEVKSGDSPYSIAKKYSWASADDIMAWNNIDNPSKLRVGQKLKIFKKK